MISAAYGNSIRDCFISGSLPSCSSHSTYNRARGAGRNQKCLSYLLFLFSRIAETVGFLFLERLFFSFVVNVCVCYSASPSFSPFQYRITKPESLRLEMPLLLLEWCLSLRLAYCTKIHNREPDKASIECSKINECEMLTAQRHLSSSSSRSSQCLWWKRIFDVFIAFWKRTV